MLQDRFVEPYVIYKECNQKRFQPPEAIQIAFPAASARVLANAIAHLFVTITTNQNASLRFVI